MAFLMVQPSGEQLRLVSIIDCDQQDQLAKVVYTITLAQGHCMSLPHGSHVAVTNVQQVVEEDVELTRFRSSLCVRDF
jgi:hypothetical protein